MVTFETVCIKASLFKARLKLAWLQRIVAFRMRRLEKARAHLKCCEYRGPTYEFKKTLDDLRCDLWTVELVFWQSPIQALRLFGGAVRRHLSLRRKYIQEFREYVRAKRRYYRYELQRLLQIKYQTKRIKKAIYRSWHRMPRVCVEKHNGIAAVVLRRDYKRGKRVFMYARESVITGTSLGSIFVPGRTMLFAKPGAHSKANGRAAAEVVTGTLEDMEMLLKGCVVHNFPRNSGALFVPYAAHREKLTWQREQFPPISLNEAYRMVWGRRRIAPTV